MSAIQNLDESWKGHTFKEIEDFVKEQINEIEEGIEELRELMQE